MPAPVAPPSLRAIHRLSIVSLQSGILVLGIGFLLRITGAIPLDPTGTLIFSLGLLLVAGFEFAAALGIRWERGGWERAAVLAGGTGALILALGVTAALHMVLGGMTLVLVAAVLTLVAISGIAVTIFAWL